MGKKSLFIWIAALFLLSMIVQSFFLINWDVSWDIHAARRIWQGGSYTNNFFDFNLLSGLILYVPVVWLIDYVHLPIPFSLYLYVYSLAVLGLALCYPLIKKLFPENNTIIAIFLSAAAVIFVLLPQSDFSQRDHIAMMLTLPYIVLASLRLQSIAISKKLALSIGLLAGLGFGIKPDFLIVPALIELYVAYHFTKDTAGRATTLKFITAWWRPEVLACLAVLAVLLTVMLFYYRDYFTLLVPLALRYYYAGFGDPWTTMLIEPINYFCAGTFLLCIIFLRRSPYQPLMLLFSIAMLGFWLAFLMQHTPWRYHFLPALALAFLINVFVCYAFMRTHHRKSEKIFLTVLIAVVFSYPIVTTAASIHYGVENTKHYLPLIAYLKQNAQGKPIYVMSSNIQHTFPVIDYAQVPLGSRFAHMILLPGLVKNDRYPEDKTFFIQKIVEDLTRYQPDIILVDRRTYNSYIPVRNFNYIQYFSSSADFRKEWKSYRYVTSLKQLYATEVDPKNADIYRTATLEDIDPIIFRHKTVALVGNKNPYTVYYIKNRQFIYFKKLLLSAEVTLTSEELALFQNSSTTGIVKKNAENSRLYEQVVEKFIWAGMQPVYWLDVYKKI